MGKYEALCDRALEIVKENPSISFRDLSMILSEGRNENIVYSWRQRNTYNFNERYDAALKEAFAALEGDAIQCMADLIKQKDFKAAKYVLDNRGYKPEDKIKVDGGVDINITIGE